MRRAASALVVSLLLAGAVEARALAAEPAPAPVPRRSQPLADGRWASSLGFRDTVEFEVKALTKRGENFEVHPVEKFKDVAYVRILSKDARSGWDAIHVVLAEGKTFLYIVASRTAR